MHLPARLFQGEIAAGPAEELVGLPALRAVNANLMGMHRLKERHMGDPVAAEPVYVAILLLVHRGSVGLIGTRIVNLRIGI